MFYLWGIVVYCFDDYKNVGILILFVVCLIFCMKVESLIYVLLFVVVLNGLYCFGYINMFFFIIFNVFCVYWVYLLIIGFKVEND